MSSMSMSMYLSSQVPNPLAPRASESENLTSTCPAWGHDVQSWLINLEEKKTIQRVGGGRGWMGGGVVCLVKDNCEWDGH